MKQTVAFRNFTTALSKEIVSFIPLVNQENAKLRKFYVSQFNYNQLERVHTRIIFSRLFIQLSGKSAITEKKHKHQQTQKLNV